MCRGITGAAQFEGHPRLFVNRRTAPRTAPTSKLYAWRNLDVKPQALREDRILQKILATGDVRHICDFFGIRIDAAMHYTLVLTQADRDGDREQ